MEGIVLTDLISINTIIVSILYYLKFTINDEIKDAVTVLLSKHSKFLVKAATPKSYQPNTPPTGSQQYCRDSIPPKSAY